MKILSRFEALLFDTKPQVFYVALVSLALMKSGVWFVPSLKKIAEDPPNEQLTFSGFLIASAQISSPAIVFGIYLFFALAYVALIAAELRNFSRVTSRIAATAFTSLPLAFTGIFWVGPDSFLLFLLASTVVFRSSQLVVLTTSLLIGLEHFEVGFFAAVGLLLAKLVAPEEGNTPIDGKFGALMLAGVALGKTASLWLLEVTASRASRLEWWIANWQEVLAQFLLRPHVILWGVLSVAWLLFGKFVTSQRNWNQLVVGLIPAFLLLPVVEDQTRIFTLVSAPVLLILIVFNQDFLENLTKQWVAKYMALWLLIPVLWVWGGYPRWGVFSYDVAVILNFFYPDINIPFSPHWPFN